ncbi:MAG: hypothetical protein PHN98_02110 [Smithellaceae bacterium]|nr:hypothetical protein [Smithellaceae bacterium]
MAIVWCVLVLEGTAFGLSCGTFRYPKCGGPDFQFAGGFNPQTGFGGFGGGACSASRTPVIFVHGNGERAINWDSPANYKGTQARSVYQELKARGYNDCELFGITYLSPGEQRSPAGNYHNPRKYDTIIAFIEAVKIYTGKDKVDIVAHSLGVSMALAALTYEDNLHRGEKGWADVRRFVNIAGGIRGLPSCLAAGFSNPYFVTCGSQNVFNKYIFGFYPDSHSSMGFNRWTGAEGPMSLRRAPLYHPEVIFYTLHAGYHDQIHCTTARRYRTCNEGALFEKSENVRAQLNIGSGQKARKGKFNFDEWRPASLSGGDADGVGHFKARNNAGPIVYEMLNTDCSGIHCKGLYTGGPVTQ